MRVFERRLALLLSLLAFASIAWMLTQKLMPVMFGVYLGIVNVITFALYAYDKAAAIRQRARVSEFSLHMWSLMCGWPAGVLAQLIFNHKTTKLSFRVQHWAVLVVNLVAVYLIAKQSHFY